MSQQLLTVPSKVGTSAETGSSCSANPHVKLQPSFSRYSAAGTALRPEVAPLIYVPRGPLCARAMVK